MGKIKAEKEKLLSFYKQPKNWSDVDQKDDSIRNFAIDVPQSEIDDLNKRLDLVKWSVQSLPDTKSTYGLRDDTMKSIVNHWRNEYKWSERQMVFNKFNNYKTMIEGLDLHFIHERSKHEKAKPILITHGWPGSIVEFFKLIPLLAAGTETDSFHVVCVSIPGFGFSDAPKKSGFNGYECARIFNTLMNRLGYEEYIVHGGDWGSMISTCIATLFPEHVKGIHLNYMTSARPKRRHQLKKVFGSFCPSLCYPKEESAKMFPLKSNFKTVLEETGFFHIQATKPDSIGFALSDSPVGLAAYLLEKFSTWTDIDFKNTEDGSLDKHFTLDELLDNVMVYWINNSITSSMRFYKENVLKSHKKSLGSLQLKMPAGYAWYPNELITASKSEIKDKFPKLVQFTYMERGGHFAAMQFPDDLAKELKDFSSKVVIKSQFKD